MINHSDEKPKRDNNDLISKSVPKEAKEISYITNSNDDKKVDADDKTESLPNEQMQAAQKRELDRESRIAAECMLAVIFNL